MGQANASRCHILELLDPGSPAAAPTTLSEILPALYLAPAVFSRPLHDPGRHSGVRGGPGLTWFVIDAPGLATGRLTLADFGSNGHVRVSTLRRPWNMGQTMSFEQILGRYLSEVAESGIGGPPQYNEPYVLSLSLETLARFPFF